MLHLHISIIGAISFIDLIWHVVNKILFYNKTNISYLKIPDENIDKYNKLLSLSARAAPSLES